MQNFLEQFVNPSPLGGGTYVAPAADYVPASDPEHIYFPGANSLADFLPGGASGPPAAPAPVDAAAAAPAPEAPQPDPSGGIPPEILIADAMFPDRGIRRGWDKTGGSEKQVGHARTYLDTTERGGAGAGFHQGGLVQQDGEAGLLAGEYVIPREVVEVVGVETLDKLVADARGQATGVSQPPPSAGQPAEITGGGAPGLAAMAGALGL